MIFRKEIIAALLLVFLSTFVNAESARKQIVLIAGKKSHGPEGNGIHDYGWNIRLIKTMLENSNVADQVEVSIFFNGWPENAPVLKKADTIMIISDGRDGNHYGEEALHLQSPQIIDYVEKQTKRGCGLVTFHFSTFAPDANAVQILEWNGGYFDWQTAGKRSWYSAIKTMDAEVKAAAPGHPVLRGVNSFKMNEEFYYNIRFKDNDPRLKSIWEVPALKSKQPLGNTVTWAVERKDGGRGFATTCGHFYKNWQQKDYRKTILNGLVWTAQIEIPEKGVEAKYFTRDEVTKYLSQEKTPKEKSTQLKREGAFILKNNKIWQEPLAPQKSPSWKARINRDRIYDYYAKQAIFFGQQKESAMIPAYPGLDSAKGTHWGNQNDTETWHDVRALKMDSGSMVSGVIRGKNLKVTKGYSIHLKDNVHVIFDAEKMKFVKAWRGPQVNWSPVRFGLMKGLQYKSEQELDIDYKIALNTKRYKGFFRIGNRVVFALDNFYAEAIYENGQVSIKKVTKPRPSAAQWPERIKTKGNLGEGQLYAIDTLALPFKNPWNSLFFIGGVDFLSENRIVVCTVHGEVWICDVQNKDFSKLSWKRFAAGLHQPLGLKVKGKTIHVMCRDQIVALHDLNNDDEADFYECVSNRFRTTDGGHDYITGLQLDSQGRWYIASANQGVCRIDEKAKKVKVLGAGLRNPNGLAINEDASVVLTSVQEGSWTPASAICDLSQGDYFGSGGPRSGKYVKPMLYLPRGVDNTSGGQVYIESPKWGPVKGQWIHFAMGFARPFLVLRELIDGKSQAAAIVLPEEFKSGSHRGRFSPYDGQLYVAGSQGWANYGVDDGSLQRVRYTGGSYPYPSSYETRENGLLLHFDQSQSRELADKNLWFAQQWNYRYSAAYGSKEYSVEQPMKKGHDRLKIKSVQYLQDGKKVFLEIPQIQPVDQLHIYFKGKTPLEIFATVHQLDKAFTGFSGYEKVKKVYGKIFNADELSDPKELIQACTACHHPTQKVVGPSFAEIRKMYKDNAKGIVKWAKNPQVKNPQLPAMPSFSFMKDETLLKIANYILEE